MFRLQEITAMKLRCISIEQEALKKAEANGHDYEVAACRAEIDLLKREAMNPQAVLNSIQQYLGE